jgi:hypothetical protein
MKSGKYVYFTGVHTVTNGISPCVSTSFQSECDMQINERLKDRNKNPQTVSGINTIFNISRHINLTLF